MREEALINEWLIEGARKMEMQKLREEGMQEGMEKGMQKGREEGIQEGFRQIIEKFKQGGMSEEEIEKFLN